jgi:hypothetical protein
MAAAIRLASYFSFFDTDDLRSTGFTAGRIPHSQIRAPKFLRAPHPPSHF